MNSGLLTEIIRIMDTAVDNQITFHDYMALCLYDPMHGYYSTDRVKIGKEGDFYTSSSIGNFMGMMLGRAFLRILREEEWDKGSWQIVEWGGGTGRLALHILDHLQEIEPELYQKLSYTIIDHSSYHRSLQLDTLKHHKGVRFRHGKEWLAEQQHIPTIVCSNELLDAFPVHRIRYQNNRFEQLYVGWNEVEQKFVERYEQLQDPELLAYIVQEKFPERERQHFEINLEASRWIRTIVEHINQLAMVTIDYGDVREELYGPHRMKGTLMCYRQHRAHENPYIYAGDQDITAHVNFSACIEAGMKEGLNRWEFSTQRQFLVSNGILELLQTHDGANPFSEVARSNRAIRQLLLSDQMSELFKVLVQRK